EFRLWSLYLPEVAQLHPAEMLETWPGVRDLDGARKARILRTYQDAYPEYDPGEQTMAILGDYYFLAPALRLLDAQQRHAQTWAYLFAWQSPVLGGRLGAPHAMELPFVFHNLSAPGVARFTGDGVDRVAVASTMQDAWIGFARSGRPGHPGLPTW